uniref:3-hydroxyisobutyryl-CoA hydrolase n=1 Tax=Anopheles coluzzii TaxID=1518534 RepID=A0A8W7PH65_ANOCL
MNELQTTFLALQKDVSVRAVLLRSGGAHFSRGLDVAHLVQPVEKRKAAAEEMSTCLMKFLKMLVAFPKPIVAAVQGDVLGMGVTILPLFDIVIAQLGSSFVAPYGHFGYLPEALGAFSSGVRSLKAKTAMLSIKQHLRRELVTKMESALLLEQKKHAQQWATPECQAKFKLFVSKGGEL